MQIHVIIMRMKGGICVSGQRHILHIDANCYYASVEMQENPALRGKQIAVCGSKEDRHGIVLTASYPAKHMGVKTGMAIWQAKKRLQISVYAVQWLCAGDLAGLLRPDRSLWPG